MGKYSSGSRGAPAKGVDRESGARVRIPPSPPYFWPLGQAVKTPPFHGGITGSNPVGVIHKKRYCTTVQYLFSIVQLSYVESN